MKLAMPVGDSRHCVVDGVMLRHFVQTAAKAGIGAGPIKPTFDELRLQTVAKQVTASLPKGFPAEVADTSSNGIKACLRGLKDV
jgi:serine/threonine-protein kinase HipA